MQCVVVLFNLSSVLLYGQWRLHSNYFMSSLSSLQAASCGILSRYCNMHIVCSSVAGICQYYLVVACANPWKLLGDRVYFVVDGIMNVVKVSDISLCAYSEVSIIQKTVTNCCRYRWTLCFVLLSTQSCSRFNPS